MKPRKGDRGEYRNWSRIIPGTADPEIVSRFTVLRVDGDICHAQYDGQEKPSCFIWRFKDSLNTLHTWPGKGDPLYRSDLTPEGEQSVIPGCERNLSPEVKQLDLF